MRDFDEPGTLAPTGLYLGKTEVNFRLASAPQQQNQAKLANDVATLWEQLERLAEERTHEGSPRVPKAMLNEYSEKIEAIAANLVSPSEADEKECEVPSFTNSFQDSPKAAEGYHSPTLGLRKRLTPASISHDRTHNNADGDKSDSVHLDDAAQAQLDKHRYWIKRKVQLSRARQALIVSMYGQKRYTRNLPRLLASLGLYSSR